MYLLCDGAPAATFRKIEHGPGNPMGINSGVVKETAVLRRHDSLDQMVRNSRKPRVGLLRDSEEMAPAIGEIRREDSQVGAEGQGAIKQEVEWVRGTNWAWRGPLRAEGRKRRTT